MLVGVDVSTKRGDVSGNGVALSAPQTAAVAELLSRHVQRYRQLKSTLLFLEKLGVSSRLWDDVGGGIRHHFFEVADNVFSAERGTRGARLLRLGHRGLRRWYAGTNFRFRSRHFSEAGCRLVGSLGDG